jgi:hypothetical protein
MKKSMLDLATEGLYKELQRVDNDLTKIPEVTRPVALLYMFQGMVDNGGLRYPLETDFPGYPPYSIFVEAYRKIGAPKSADALSKAIALFPFEKPEQDSEARNAFMPVLGDDHEFNELSDQIGAAEDIWNCMDEYVASHNADFAPFITQ